MHLLYLPVEIREQILKDLLDINGVEAPDSPALTISGREVPPSGGHTFCKKLQNPALPALLVNRQLQAEMEGVIKRKKSEQVSYSLDMMFVKGSGLWPTWLSVPVLSTDIDTIYAPFRVFHRPDNLPVDMELPDMWNEGGDRGPPFGFWMFYSFFIGLIRQIIGPWPHCSEREADKITIQRFVLDVITPVEPDTFPLVPPASPQPGFDHADRPNREAESVDSPSTVQRLAGLIQREIDWFICTGNYRKGDGNVLYERFGSIEMRVDGTRYHMWDLSDLFAKLPLRDHQWGTWAVAQRKASYREWKIDTLERRRKAGFRIEEEDGSRRWWE